MPNYEEARGLLRVHHQEHLLHYWDELDTLCKQTLLEDIGKVDFKLISRLHNLAVTPGMHAEEEILPLRGRTFDSFPVPERSVMSNAGFRMLREGKVAALLVAGGQGTRLGIEGPKGTLDIGLPSKKSLFQLQAERLLNLSRQCGRAIPWMIMTSRENHAQTENFFKAQAYFGLNPGQTAFFPQKELPILDLEGKILLTEKHRIATGPNGNGGCFAALKDSGNLSELKKQGVEWLFVYSVDNALVRVCDPRFLGMASKSGLPVASKYVTRKEPGERVGVFCRRKGLPSVVEYSEMTPAMASAMDASGTLAYGAANIAIHLFQIDYLEKHSGETLPYHVARKKIQCLDSNGKSALPAEPNAHKFELFMFDLFSKSDRICLMEVDRDEEFAPVKNSSHQGEDSPETARRLLLELYRKWALEAGFSAVELKDLEIEVSPLTSYAGENLRKEIFRRDPLRPILLA